MKQIPLRIFVDEAVKKVDQFLSVSIAESRQDLSSRSCHPPAEGRAAALSAAEQISTPAAVLAKTTIDRHDRAAGAGGVQRALFVALRDGGDVATKESELRSEFLAIKNDYEKLRIFLAAP